jgi:hypothetical protein
MPEREGYCFCAPYVLEWTATDEIQPGLVFHTSFCTPVYPTLRNTTRTTKWSFLEINVSSRRGGARQEVPKNRKKGIMFSIGEDILIRT